MWYFAITTLSTIGYGDFSPQSKEERLIAITILLFGVTMFSFIMSQFIEILLNYNSLSQFGHHKDLSKWIALLSRFNNGNPLNKDLISQIEDFFDYYWENNRLGAFVLEEDMRFMSELPASVQGEIFVDYLFKDFIYKYRGYFSPASKNTIAMKLKKLKTESYGSKKKENLNESHKIFAGSNDEQKNRSFLISFVQKLEPRFFDGSNNTNLLIQDQCEEVFEVTFITNGAVAVGYRLFNEIFYGITIVMTSSKKIISPINDCSCIQNKVSEFLYKPIENVEALGIRKEHFIELMENAYPKSIMSSIPLRYRKTV